MKQTNSLLKLGQLKCADFSSLLAVECVLQNLRTVKSVKSVKSVEKVTAL